MAVLLPMFWFAARAISRRTISIWDLASEGKAEWLYLYLSVGLGVFFIGRWIRRKLQSPPDSLLSAQQSIIDAQRELGRNIYLTSLAKLLKRIPFNQSHLIAIDSFEVGLDRLPHELDGLKICHLSDFHLTGQIDLAYFERVVEETNRFEPDLILVTGDLIDELDCLDWIDSVFGQLKSKHGTFFIRGNHDLRIADQEMLLQRLRNAGPNGMVWVGGKCESVSINGATVSLTGNELPWHSGAESLGRDSLPDNALHLLLSHSPDQIDWAKPFEFDLIFAGHNHGGQIAIPFVGPIVAPSKFGVLYASGNFQIEKSFMHVSRGLSGDECIRINCPPEVGCFTLRKT